MGYWGKCGSHRNASVDRREQYAEFKVDNILSSLFTSARSSAMFRFATRGANPTAALAKGTDLAKQKVIEK